MNEQQLYLSNQGLKELNVSEEESAFLYQLGTTLGHHPEILRDSYLAFLRGEEDYEYKPLIGAPLHFHFEGDQVSLTRLDVVFSLLISQFLHFLALVDLAFGKIYPLGTIVELDRELLPRELVQKYASEDLDLYALLVGRRVQLDNQTYIDYVGHVYPYGMRLDTLPLYISQLFIKRVFVEGYSDAKDSHYIDRDLREAYFKAAIYSSIYKETTDED